MIKRVMPTTECIVHWSEWNSLCEVRRFGTRLWITPPRGIPVKISKRIAGKFTVVEPNGGDFVVPCKEPK